MSQPTEQAERDSRCPECGGEPTDGSAVEHHLSAMGYLHDDQQFECSECGHGYAHGVPAGEFDGDASDLWCDVCDLGYMTIHRVEKTNGGMRLHMKCGNHHALDCPECEQNIPASGLHDVRNFAGGKCPHCSVLISRGDVPYCFYFTFAHRETDHSYISLIGWPRTTGNVSDATDAYGYNGDGV